MNTPTAALAREFWRRHRRRLVIIAVIVLGFILAYPFLCAAEGFNPDSRDAASEFARLLAPCLEHPMPLRIIQVLYLMFLIGGPVVAMALSLLCVIWMFTFTEVDPENRNPLAFPVRLFTLPVSTSFLFWRITISGLVTLLGLCALWNYGVHQPLFETFRTYQNTFVWMTLLVLAQATVWALAAWPFTRMLVLTVLLMLSLSPAGRDLVESPLVLAPLFLLGLLLARISLQKLRHGEWQGRIWYHWQSRFTRWIARAKLRGPRKFSSPAQAQLWFEWRRSAARGCLVTSILVLLPLLFLAVRAACGYPPLQTDDLTAVTFILFGAPLVIFGLLSISPTRSDLPFMFTRPLTNSAIVASILKSTALSALLSWVAVLVATSALTWLGDYHRVLRQMSSFPARRVALVIGLVFLTWRSAAVNLGFVLTENRKASAAPVWALVLVWLAGTVIFLLTQSGVRFGWFWNHLTAWAAALVAVKFLCAGQIYRTALKRRLLTRAAVRDYLIVWSLLVAALMATLLLLVKPDQTVIVPAGLGVILLVPLVRIGLAPLSLAWARHASGGPTTRWSEFRWRSTRAKSASAS